MTSFISPNIIRANFSSAMSAMYSEEVPAYGQLLKIVAETNEAVLQRAGDNPPLEHSERLSQERHGAIRLGTADELAMMARTFSVMGMYPVGYYDLSIASIPVHSTAFRPVEMSDLEQNPFRIFTSLLRLELIEDEALRRKAKAILEQRQIFSDEAIALTEKAERQGGLDEDDAKRFVAETLETFRWHEEACVDIESFDAFIGSHRLTADIVSFKGPHINHLTPRTLDIDMGQAEMMRQGLPAKAVIEGPPKRNCPLLLRQTAFKALEEPVKFLSSEQGWVEGRHTARFGEIEQRGVALTPKGRALYDRLLLEARAKVTPDPAGRNAKDYEAALSESFQAFPDDWRALYDEGLAYFKFSVGIKSLELKGGDVTDLLDSGALMLLPIIYEDFLPVSAAGIFQSNLGDEARDKKQATSRQSSFEEAMGRKVINEFELYAGIQEKSLAATLLKMKMTEPVS